MISSESNITCSKAARLINRELLGGDIVITHLSSMANIDKRCITFAKSVDEDFINKANEISELFVIAGPEYKDLLSCPHVISQNPRLDFIRVLRKFFAEPRKTRTIHPTAIIEDGAVIGAEVSIGANCYIGAGVSIGEGSEIHHNVVIIGKVAIGRDCIIKSGAVIGEEGFGFECDEHGEPLRFPHVGKVVIGDDVFIGANSTVERATIDETVIGNNVKIDDLVQIGHNCKVGDNTMIAAGTITCGGVTIGRDCWVAPNVSIRQRLTVGDGGYIGLGSVVINDVAAGKVVVGVPAKELNK